MSKSQLWMFASSGPTRAATSSARYAAGALKDDDAPNASTARFFAMRFLTARTPAPLLSPRTRETSALCGVAPYAEIITARRARVAARADAKGRGSRAVDVGLVVGALRLAALAQLLQALEHVAEEVHRVAPVAAPVRRRVLLEELAQQAYVFVGVRGLPMETRRTELLPIELQGRLRLLVGIQLAEHDRGWRWLSPANPSFRSVVDARARMHSHIAQVIEGNART